MLTLKQETVLIERIKKLSELELDGLLKQIGEHLRKNNLEHLIDNSFDIETHEDELNDANNVIEELESSMGKIHSITMDVEDIDELDEKAHEKLINAIQEISNIATS